MLLEKLIVADLPPNGPLTLAEMVDRAVSRDLQDPRAPASQATVEARSGPPCREERVLADVIGWLPTAKDVNGERVRGGDVSVVEHRERVDVGGRDAAQQGAVRKVSAGPGSVGVKP